MYTKTLAKSVSGCTHLRQGSKLIFKPLLFFNLRRLPRQEWAPFKFIYIMIFFKTVKPLVQFRERGRWHLILKNIRNLKHIFRKRNLTSKTSHSKFILFLKELSDVTPYSGVRRKKNCQLSQFFFFTALPAWLKLYSQQFIYFYLILVVGCDSDRIELVFRYPEIIIQFSVI